MSQLFSVNNKLSKVKKPFFFPSILILVFSIILIGGTLFGSIIRSNKSEMKNFDFVPDEATAISIAQVIFDKHYKKTWNRNIKLKASLIRNTAWIVSGVLEEDEIGGVPKLEIRKKDGMLSNMSHGK